MNKLKPATLRTTEPTQEQLNSIIRQEIYIVLDNVLDTYNVGAIFRLADAVGAAKVYLCGGTETPPNSRIKKASINTWQWTPWVYSPSAVDAIQDLRKTVRGINIIGVEQHEKSIPFDSFDYKLPIALVVGNETDGCSPKTLDACDSIVELPMFGINTSLNVMVTLGIVLYKVAEEIKNL
ncbi:MAG: TrmH family RNA methyltransferase [Candidatus Levybacteria bacterium]|nr:TrmH family RNA methyltransferase [Candidatus Levybacteria bacterium]MBP9814909.1 TrmH family RNA methyltransferase [Candidatus Levybacteria bacterium]